VSAPPRGRITLLLQAIYSEGDERARATDQLFELVYAEMRRIAGGLMHQEREGHTLQPTALVHEAYLRLIGQAEIHWQDRAHFFRIAVGAMRRILVEHARARAADKRGGGWQRVTFSEALQADGGNEFEVIELDSALSRLAAMDERMEQVVSMRVFGGMEMHAIAHVLGVSERTVYDDWSVARLWLGRELAHGGGAA
jgi:RNA polymerase sigma factor (TIGR02999 family)